VLRNTIELFRYSLSSVGPKTMVGFMAEGECSRSELLLVLPHSLHKSVW
jgi:hypothetical protein